MLILLPPSEGKTRPQAGSPVDLESLTFPELAQHREHIMRALSEVSAQPDAMTSLAVGASLEPEVRANVDLHQAAVAPAHSIYSGVLYDALGFGSLTPTQRRKAAQSVVVMSGLWGAVGFGDPIPAYRLSMGVDLPGVGKLAGWWRPRLKEALDQRAAGQLVIDCRSSTYAAAYKAPAESTVAVDVVQERGGTRKVVSHFAKHTRGQLVRHLLGLRGPGPRSATELLSSAQTVWPTTELVPASKNKPARLIIVLPEDHSFATSSTS
ncbi:YaaA family protein [Galactobacter caseinivorans]|uniref:Peroxide stress protein YaaA n=1 Tax=Galactobacter caseinivorans TaxID=2676123 RepID=A0A496PGX9_9MICC|nr:peroxide stress protein YaaA [Galactobacter caseinivorans]RKW69737.1 peroxide stress protein YaaA [Galactobacter caseinivorans]